MEEWSWRRGLRLQRFLASLFLLVIAIENTFKGSFWLASLNSLNFSLTFSKLRRLRQFIIASEDLKEICPVLCLYKYVLLCCGVRAVPASWNISNKLSLLIYLLSQSYSMWQNLVMWPTAKYLGLDFQVLSTLCSIRVFYAPSKKQKGFIYE